MTKNLEIHATGVHEEARIEHLELSSRAWLIVVVVVIVILVLVVEVAVAVTAVVVIVVVTVAVAVAVSVVVAAQRKFIQRRSGKDIYAKPSSAKWLPIVISLRRFIFRRNRFTSM